MDLLDKLAKAKLKQPKGIKQFIWNHTTYKVNPYGVYQCVEHMEKWRGTWILRVFAFNLHCKRTYANIQIHEVQRVLLGYKEYLSSTYVWNTAMGGRKIEWSATQRFCRVKKNWDFYGYKMYDEQEIINELKIPYCAWDIYKEFYPYFIAHKLRFIDYIALYLKYPKIELLVKAGAAGYLPSIRYLDLKKKKLHEIFKIDQKWEFVIGHQSISDILILRKHPEFRNLDDLEMYKQIFNCSYHSYKYIKKHTQFLKLVDYLAGLAESNASSYNTLSDYNDYLRFAEELGYDLKRSKVLYPDKLKKAHNTLAKEHARKQKQINEAKFLEQFEKYKSHEYQGMGLLIIPVRSQDELINESKVLQHCVRTYADRVADGETEILLVRKTEKPDIPYVTVEVKDNRVVQARAEHNHTPAEEVKKFLAKWAKKNKIQYAY